ncbi:5126_t:CDS:1 [Racocetra fulgida]|uniref:5126_t:CDS:1 n=1 Tax=Racocetra fulgida TaxID=60492 RepID=A0A9N9AHC6_9GLOM|nr:5126_t:CDS:1 [Racocetra fulgida]
MAKCVCFCNNKKLTELAKYFPELAPLLDSIDSYSLCGGHYNQLVTKNLFINKLKKETNPILLSPGESKKKRLKFFNNDEPQVSERTFVNFGTQVERTFIDFSTQVERTFVNFSIQVVLLKKKACTNFGSQVSFLHPMCEILQKRIDKLEKNNEQLLSENEPLKKKLIEKFTNQQDCIHSIIKIAKKE